MNLKDQHLDQYKLVKTLGTGYSGTVMLGVDQNSKKEYAIKILDKTKPNISRLE